MAEPEQSSASEDAPLTHLPFPPVTKQHVLNCSFHSWHPRYRKITPKARLIPLSRPFLNYLRADGIILPPDEEASQRDWSDDDSGIFSSTETPDEDGDGDEDPSREWPEIHNAIRDIIVELGGKVCPKLNWSSPKDATWINATNTMDCRTPGDIYMMLKSSDFITHDLEQAFADTEDAPAVEGDRTIASESEVPYHLVLRKFFMINPSVEFRCFVRNRRLLAITQRDPNHYEFLGPMVDQLRRVINALFEDHLRDGFPDPNFAFDVYVPPKYDKAWLIDINPWAQRTDPLLFSWLELLTMDGPEHLEETMRKEKEEEEREGFVRLQLRPANSEPSAAQPDPASIPAEDDDDDDDAKTATPDSDDEADEEIWIPELRLVKRDDPEAYSFASPAYSAHKLPKDVVDASNAGEGGMREFAEKWKEILAREQEADRNYSSSEDGA
ncbi:cell division cycle protein 123 [Diplodia corticola]|uniref:Cell division cycle protein 123 n=1 Tax=Diplodia corticola TaxID=236234 RepID=A0A1J9QU09_9PEZI|nr:cell division cycle protein 123 [Diplodia corticola]OJD31889.1 cell division cycle protein 123 [Diplodia corticola]